MPQNLEYNEIECGAGSKSTQFHTLSTVSKATNADMKNLHHQLDDNKTNSNGIRKESSKSDKQRGTVSHHLQPRHIKSYKPAK